MDKEEIRQVNLEDWEQSGEGSFALTYNHRTDCTLILKLNSEAVPLEDTIKEYNYSKSVCELGVKCPAPICLASDGKRYGYITERLTGKKSFARIISENPDMLEPLARDMAEEARRFHSIPCDTTQFEPVAERLLNELDSCGWVKEKVKKQLQSYVAGLRPVTTCLHGDMHPGNILRTAKGDFWIDLGRFGYGDPDLDYASQYVLAYLAPEHMSKLLLHIDYTQYRRFVELYGQYYYGDEFRSAETRERLRRAVCVVLCHAIAKSAAAGFIYSKYVMGHEKTTRVFLKLINFFMNH